MADHYGETGMKVTARSYLLQAEMRGYWKIRWLDDSQTMRQYYEGNLRAGGQVEVRCITTRPDECV